MKRIKALWGWISAFTILVRLQPKAQALSAQIASCGACWGSGYQGWIAGDQYEVQPCENCGQNLPTNS